MATGHEDFAGYVALYGEYAGQQVQVAFSATGDVEIVWVD